MKLLLVLLLSLVTTLTAAAADKPSPNALGKSEEESYEGKVVVIKVGESDLINRQAFKFFRRTLERVNEEKAKAVIFELNTPGGLAHETTDLMMKDMSSLKVPSYAFVNIEASSAGAFIAVATDTIYMAPLSTIGSAAVVSGTGEEIEATMRAKIEGKLKSVVRNVAETKGHNFEVVEAMMIVDKESEFGDVKVGKGELLNLTAAQATTVFEGKPLLAKGIATSVEDLLIQEGMEGAEVVVAAMTGFEKFAYWIGTVGAVLILIGLGAGYLEMKTPGFGVGAIIAIVAFSTFFFGNYVAGNLAGYETAAIFVVGIIFILLDIFLFPGTFVLGLTGVAMVLGSLLFSMVDRFSWQDWGDGDIGLWKAISGPSTALAIGLLGSIVLFALLMRFLPNVGFLNRYLLPAAVEGGTGKLADERGAESRVGWTGVASTDLRPSGKAVFQEKTLDVTAENHFVAAGAPLRIISEDGMRIVVKEIDPVA
ncbi:NfeD family protein [Roseibacillus persicicus]|uniref:NfeD family protein n=1 Tax=Roseibacillus persicicus TaxID=454148 RepID=UPI00280DE08F|nr:NfeD family protein [Roseibacillus persicicus]MDQ8191885.1 NfeD family protein [Roseibacillus persicicus]